MKVTTQLRPTGRVITIVDGAHEGSVNCTFTEDPVEALRTLAAGARKAAERQLAQAARWERAADILEAQ